MKGKLNKKVCPFNLRAMLLTMLLIRHKTRHVKFMVGIPVIIILQLAIVFVIWKVFYG